LSLAKLLREFYIDRKSLSEISTAKFLSLQAPVFQWIKKSIDGFLFNNLYIGFCAAFLAFSVKAILKLNSGFHVEIFIFLSTVSTYTLQRIIPRYLNCPVGESKSVFKTHSYNFLLSVLTLMAALAVFFSFFNNKSAILPWLCLIFILCLWYSAEIRIQELHIKNLRSFPYLKLFLIAGTWICAVVFIPVAEAGKDIFNYEVLFAATELLFFLLAVILPFDIRDIHADLSIGIKTIPLRLGEERSKVLAVLLLLLSGGISLLRSLYLPHTAQVGVVLFCVCILSGAVILKSNKNRSSYFFSLIVDSAIFMRGIAALFFDI
jgi:4-hydroxybenzoate polyprenyltransferase